MTKEKKRILIVSHALELGGAEKSLIGLLHSLDYNNYQVDLFLLRHEGELMEFIPSGVNLLDEIPEYTVLARPMKNTLREGHILLTLARLYGRECAKIYNRLHRYTDSGVGIEYSHKYTYRLMPQISKGVQYDLAISFLTPHYIAMNNVNAKKRIAWIHTDYSKVQINLKSELSMWKCYDFIASISEDVTKAFVEKFPSLKTKIVLIENILPEQLLRMQSDEFDVSNEMPPKGLRILSIGRYCYAKNFDSIPEICSKLVQKGWDLKWYIIGFGGDEKLIEEKIKQYNMGDTVILLGKKPNPYPYISNCDVYIQPSRYEGKCVSVREAQLLGKPVIITDYSTAKSQIQNGIDGIIVPMDSENCAERISQVLTDRRLLKQISDNCLTGEYSNKSEVEKIYQYLEK